MMKILIATTALSVVMFMSAFAADDDDAPPPSPPPQAHSAVRDFVCGAVTLRYEMYERGSFYRSRYHVVNPDAISYDRSLGVPRFIVEWSSDPRKGELVTLNGYPCTPVPMPVAKR
jgi:hypothetical protein